MDDIKKRQINQQAAFAAHIAPELFPIVDKSIAAAFDKLMGYFESGNLTHDITVSILGEIKGYRLIKKKFESDIKKAQRVN